MQIIDKVKQVNINKEIIIVDDGSIDGTRDKLREVESEKFKFKNDDIKIIYHNRNMGKGAAIRTGLAKVTGDYVIVQDADLEYDPQDYHKLLKPVLNGKANVVYGSRFKGKHQNMSFHHWIGNKFLTLVTNILYNTSLSDMETCYKLWPADIIKAIRINSNHFNFEPEVTAKVLKKKVRIYEVPISYTGRDYKKGKKITWRDGFSALGNLIKYRFLE